MKLTSEEIKLIDKVERWLRDSKVSVLNPFSENFDPKKVAELRERDAIIKRALSEKEVIPTEAESLWAGL